MIKQVLKFMLGLLFAFALLLPAAAVAEDAWWGAPAKTRRMSDADKAVVDKLLKESKGTATAKPVPSTNNVPVVTQAEEKDLRSDDVFRKKIQAATRPIYEQEILDLIPGQKGSVDSFVPPTSQTRPKVRVRSLTNTNNDGLGLNDLRGLGNEYFEKKTKKKRRRKVRRRRRRKKARRSRPLFADEYDKLRRRNRRGRKLRVASREPNGFRSQAASTEVLRTEGTTQASLSPLFRLSVLGGYTSAASSNVANFSQGSQNVATQSSFAFGLNADVQRKYIGAEIEGYYGLAPEKNEVNGQATFKQFGVLPNVKAQLPLKIGTRARLIPKIGVGYGFIKQDQESITPEGVNISGSTSVSGLFGVAGVEVVASPSLTFFADFAISFGAGASTSSTVAGSAAGNTSLASRFDRIRFGASIRVANHIRLGGQYINRSLSFGADSSSLVTTEASQQFMGLLMYEF